jgi:CYTH domain-containing protein/predicted ATPase
MTEATVIPNSAPLPAHPLTEHPNFSEPDHKRVFEIVLTGGPCAGKTTAMAVLSQKLSDYGFKVLVCPETASLVINSGVDAVSLASGDPALAFELQRKILRTQRALRQSFREIADLYEVPVALLFDRGEMDNAAYIDPQIYAALLEEEHLTLFDVRDSYDLVLHLVTAAEGAEDSYTLTNNTARSESPELARELDRKTLNAWLGHPRLRIIDNSTDFDAKINRTLGSAVQLLDRPAPLEVERKFLLSRAPDLEALSRLYAIRPIDIEQTYLTSPAPGVELRVRKRTDTNHSSYYRTEKVTLSPGHRLERERILTPSEYLHLLDTRDPERQTVKKTRYCFTASGLYFELDHIRSPKELWLLEVELTEDSTEVVVPEALSIEREVTQDPSFKNAELARGL